MTMNKKIAEPKEISSFEELRERKKEVSREIESVTSNVKKSTDQLIEDGVKVVAVGFVAFLISRLLNVFMGGEKKQPGEQMTMAFDTEEKTSRTKSESATGREESSGESKRHENGHHSTLDTALIWLETISGGIDAAKIIISQIAEMKDQTQQKESSERSKDTTA